MSFTDERSRAAKEERCQRLLNEILSGEIQKDVLLNSSYDFAGEVVADYFERTLTFMNTTLGRKIMYQ